MGFEGLRNMGNELSEEQVERLMTRISIDAGMDSNAIDEVATSPQVWWAVQRRIAGQRGAIASPWPPSIWRRWFMIGVPVAAALLLASIIMLRSGPEYDEKAYGPGPAGPAAKIGTPEEGPISSPALPKPAELKAEPGRPASLRAAMKSHLRPASLEGKKQEVGAASHSTGKGSEMKTDFIALTYGRDPESGQIVRIKVPRSMMVSLGLVSSVEKPASMVDAEVLVGDDGRTHAIRFIRQ